MASNFKCVLELNENNLSNVRISINGNINKISFADVYNKMKETNGLKDISYETHNFEIFDEEFGDYIQILDQNDIIETLSKIRVIRKKITPIVQQSYSYINNNKNSLKSQPERSSTSKTEYSVLITPPNTQSSQTSNSQPVKQQTITYFNINSNPYIPSTSKAKYSVFNTLPKSQSSQSCSSSQTECETIQSSDLKSILSTDLTDFKIKSMETMIRIINENKQRFIDKHLNFYNWIIVSNRMKKFGFHSFNAKKCKKDFYYFASIYRKVLEYMPNIEKACGIYSLFMSFHSMDLSPFYVTTNPTFKNLCLLRDKFALKQESIQNCYNSEINSNPVNNKSAINRETNEIEITYDSDSYRRIIKREEELYDENNEYNSDYPSKKIKI